MISRDDLPETPDWVCCPADAHYHEAVAAYQRGELVDDDGPQHPAELPERFELGEN